MKYDFDKVVERTNTNSVKYDNTAKVFGTKDVIPLWIADMDFKTAQPIIDALKQTAEFGIFGYVLRPDNYFEAACEWKLKRHGWRIDPAACSFSMGVVQAMIGIILTFAKQNPKVLIQPPVYSEFYTVVKRVKGEAVESKLIEKDGEWSIDWDDFEQKLKQVSVFLLCNPQNPTGNVWDKETIQKMVELCDKYGVLMISDEIHSDFVFNDKQFVPSMTVNDLSAKTVISCFSSTKTFNLAGLQACSVVFPNTDMKLRFDDWMNSIAAGRNNSFSVVAMDVCYREGGEWLDQLIPYIYENLKYTASYFQTNIPKLKVKIPDSTYLCWVDCRNLGMEQKELCEFLVKKAGVGLNSGAAFSTDIDGFMRLNIACPRSILEKALLSIKQAVDKL